MNPVVIIGARGQLGADLMRLLDGRDVRGLGREDLDVTDADAVASVIHALSPSVVINATAYNKVDLAEVEPATAFAVNALGPLFLARACASAGALLIHGSTDYVFSAPGETPWREDDTPSPSGVYATSKVAGEHLVRKSLQEHVVVRTSGLYGLHGQGGKGGNFVETMLRLAAERPEVSVVADQTLTPTFTEDLATVIVAIVDRWLESRDERFHGLLHVVNAGSCTWFEFAAEIFRLAGATTQLSAITTADYGAPAARPPYSVLSCSRLERLGLAQPRAWQVALADYLAKRAPERDQSVGNQRLSPGNGT